MTTGDIVKIKVNQNVKLVETLNDENKILMVKDKEYIVKYEGEYKNKLLFKYKDKNYALHFKYIDYIELLVDYLPFFHSNIYDN